MKKTLISLAFACAALAALPVRTQSEASALSAVSALPLASVMVGASAAAGASVAVPVMLSAAGEAIAFLPNALGRALLHNERITY